MRKLIWRGLHSSNSMACCIISKNCDSLHGSYCRSNTSTVNLLNIM